MIRLTSLSLLVAAATLLAESSARGQLPVAPPPREIRPDGSRDPAPQPEPPAKPEDPAAVVDRIIKNSKDVGDKLANRIPMRLVHGIAAALFALLGIATLSGLGERLGL